MYVSVDLDSYTVIRPSSPTRFTASAISLPIVESLFAEIVATFKIESDCNNKDCDLIDCIASAVASSIPFFNFTGFVPCAIRDKPSFRIVCARTIEVVVPSPETSKVLLAISCKSCAPKFSLGSSSFI